MFIRDVSRLGGGEGGSDSCKERIRHVQVRDKELSTSVSVKEA